MAVTVYTPSPTLNLNDNNENTNFRVFVQLSGNSNGQIRVTFAAHSTNNWRTEGSGFGKWDGVALDSSNCNTTTSIFRLTYGGSNIQNITGGSTGTSDWITHTGLVLNSGDWLVVTYVHTLGVGGAERYSSGHTTCTTAFRSVAADYSQVQDVGTVGGNFSIVGSVQPGGSGGYNFGVALVETNDPSGGGGAVAVAGMSPMGEGITHSRNARGTLHPIGRGWTGWRRQGKLIVPDRKILRRA